MNFKRVLGIGIFVLAIVSVACKPKTTEQTNVKPSRKIVALHGSVTEVIFELGLDSLLVGVDVTSTYPEAAKSLPQVGHNRNISVENILQLQPTDVIGLKKMMKPEIEQQLTKSGVNVHLLDQEFSIDGAQKFVHEVCKILEKSEASKTINANIVGQSMSKETLKTQPKVLFIYARGTGNVMGAGNNTPAKAMIELAGGINAFTDFEEFKPLTPEALIAANPDVILLFDDGLKSLGGIDGLLAIPGISATNAGKNKKIIEMDGQFLTGFGPRTGAAVTELSKKLKALE